MALVVACATTAQKSEGNRRDQRRATRPLPSLIGWISTSRRWAANAIPECPAGARRQC